MSEGGAESAGEENSDTKADFFEKGGVEENTFANILAGRLRLPLSLSLSLSLFFFLLALLPFANAHKTCSGAIRVHPVPPPPHSPPLRGPQSCNYTRNHDPNFTGSLRPAFPPSARKDATK